MSAAPAYVVIDALLSLRAAALQCAKAADACSGFSDYEASNGQAIVDALRTLFRPRRALARRTAPEPEAPLIRVLPREVLIAILSSERLETRDLASFGATCLALYRHAPPHQESVVALALQHRAEVRGCSAAGLDRQGVPALLRREWQHARYGQFPLLASVHKGEVSAFIDSDGRLLTCGTETAGPDHPAYPSEWMLAAGRTAQIRVLASPTVVPAMCNVRFRCVAAGREGNLAVSREGKVYCWGDGECQLGHDEPADGETIEGLAGVRVRTVCLGRSPTSFVYAAVSEEGALYTWGDTLAVEDEPGPSGIGYPASDAPLGGSFVVAPQQVTSLRARQPHGPIRRRRSRARRIHICVYVPVYTEAHIDVYIYAHPCLSDEPPTTLLAPAMHSRVSFAGTRGLCPRAQLPNPRG